MNSHSQIQNTSLTHEDDADFQQENWLVKGMDCAGCAASIEKIVRALPGVKTASVNYGTEKLRLEWDSGQIEREAIVQTVRSLGYQIGENKRHHHHHSHDAPQNWWTRRLELNLSLLCGALTAGAFVGERLLNFPAPTTIGLCVLAYAAGAWNLARHTLPALVRARFNVDLLMLVAAIGAAILGQWIEGALLLFLFSLGHALEHGAMERARAAIGALGSVVPKTARVRRDGSEIQIEVDDLRVGDLAIVRPGERLSVDGVVAKGHSSLDQSPITGESVPVEKSPGDAVLAGSLNGDGALEISVSKLARDTTMARVVEMVEEAQSQKSPTQTFAESFERVFVPTILILVACAAILPPLFHLLTWNVAVSRALSALVAASPCALALATPAAVLAGIGQAARNGVLIKGGVHLENLGAIKALALDKTGTLTRGQPQVCAIFATKNSSEREVLQLAAALESRATHPLALAVVRRAQNENLTFFGAMGETQTVPGRGVWGEIEGQIVRLGNLALLEDAQISIPDEARAQIEAWNQNGLATMILARDETVLGALALADEIRPEARAALQNLQKLGVEVTMLTGDNQKVAQNVARAAGIADFRADLLPNQKALAVRELLQAHKSVAMIGDGVNDAPALATATVGIAMGAGGTDVALETADVALMSDDLHKLSFAIGLSRFSRQIIRQNLFIALGVIALLVPATLLGLTGIGWAVVFHEGSTLVVVFNALRLLGYREKTF